MPGQSPDDGPPAPDGRPWIHPSELPGATPGDPGPHRRSRFAVPLTAGLAGALAALGAVSMVWPSDSSTRASLPGFGAGPTVLTLGEGGGVPAPVARVAAWSGPSVRYGSSVVFRSDGLLVTSAALVAGAAVVEVVTHDGRHVEAELVGTDPENDLALLRVEGSGLGTAADALGEAADVQPGDACLLVGAGDASTRGPTVDAAIVAGTGAVWPHRDGWLVDAIEVDGTVHDATVGGALLDARGRLLGIVTSTRGPVSSGPMVVRVEHVRRSMEDLLAHGEVRHAWLGLASDDAPPPLRGALVREVSPVGPASRAGVEPGDVVVSLGGDGVDGSAGLMRAVRRHDPGDRVPLVVVRAGEPVELAVVLAVRR